MMLFLSVRALHVLLAAIWFGATVANIFFLTPSIIEAKASGGQVMAGIMRRGYATFLTAISGIVTLSGLYLYYKFTLGFDPIASAAMPARIVGTGAVAGLIASITGPMFVSRPIKRVGAIMAKAGSMADGAEKSALLQQSAALQSSSIMWSKITLVLMTIALVTMSVGHFIS